MADELIRYTYKEALKQSMEYFGGEEISAKVFLDKYALKNKEQELLEATPTQMFERIAHELHRVEKKKYKDPLSYEEILEYLKDFKRIIPQGSPMNGVGNPYQYTTISNCYVIPSPEDSYGGICATDEKIVQISKRRGGVGTDISHLRPNKSSTTNAARTSTGIIPFMERYSNSIREVGQSGRRGALMLTISIHHPEVLDFARSKRDLKKVTGANISIRLTDEFLEAVKNGTLYEQRFPVDSKTPSMGKAVDARTVWMEIVENAHATAEPGLLFWDRIIEESPADCYSDFGYATTSTNPSLRGDTLVLTNKGIFPIQKLAEQQSNIKVKNLRGEWHNCDVFMSGKNKQLMKITFSNNQTVYCTPEHKWPILNSSGNIINPQTGKVKKKETVDLKRQDKIYFPSLGIPTNPLKCKYSFEDGFVVGWNMGDGWTSYHKLHKSKQYGFIFSQEDIDSKIGERVLDYTNNLAKRDSCLKQDHNSNAYTYCTTDTAVVESFEEKGLYCKKDGIPKTIWEGNFEYIRGFIDGLFSADGHIRVCEKISNCSIILVSSHEKIVSDIQKLLAFYGIRSNYRKSISKNHKFPNGKQYNKEYTRFDLVISGLDVVKFSKYFDLSNTSKQNKLDIISMKKISHNSKGRIEYGNKRDYLSVKKVEKTEIYEDVYDITVHDDTHTFFMVTGVTGNCGELPLCPYDSCRLLLLNLYGYVDNPFTNKAFFNFKKFKEDAIVAQRFMDDLVDIELEKIDGIIKKIRTDPEPFEVKKAELDLWKNMKRVCEGARRTGTGITALGDALAALGIKYGSTKSINTTRMIYKALKLACYRSSVEMAIELEPFSCWDPKLEKNNPFLLRIKEEDPDLYRDMNKYGRRNIACLTTAPAGSVSLLTQTTSGIEPCYQISYKRRKKINVNDGDTRVDFVDDKGDAWQEFDIFHPKVKIWKEVTGETDVTKSPWYDCCANDLNWLNRIKLQAVANKEVDHSISSTLNLPEDVTVEEVAKIYETAWTEGCKGVTVYREGCRAGVMVDNTAEEKMLKIKKTTAPKRPKILPADIYHTVSKGESYFVILGILGDDPYEIFAGKNGQIKKSIKKGMIKKMKRGKYSLLEENGDVIQEDISKHIDEEQEAITRLISSNLRHGCDVSFVVHQLEKVQGDLLSYSKAISRVLKKYIPDNTAVHGDSCKECGADLIREQGCVTCRSCGWSRCG